MNKPQDHTAPTGTSAMSERIKAQTRLLEKLASECWSEAAASKIRQFARGCEAAAQARPAPVKAEWPQQALPRRRNG
jgi:hypothetical protein